MSGHSKWSKIKRQKETTDKAKGNLFAKLSRLITLAVIEGGGIGDPNHNVKLRLAIEKAKQDNMPKENILRAIEKGSGPDKALLKEVIYEVFGPAGSTFIITAATDNSNRTNSEIRNVIDRHNGKMGSQGSVIYLFQQVGIIVFDTTQDSEDAILQFADRINSIDFEEEGSNMFVYIPFEKVGKIKDYLNGLHPMSTTVEFKPMNYIQVQNIDDEKKIVNLMESLENLDDVQNVYTNVTFSESAYN